MVTSPEYMFLDEPTTGLDPLTANSINELIKKTYERTHFTGIIVSHEIPEVFSLVHRVAMLWEGKIIFHGTPEEIMKSEDPRVKSFIEAAMESCRIKMGVERDDG